MDQEYQKYLVRQNTAARQARYRAGGDPVDPNTDPRTDINDNDKLVPQSHATKIKAAAQRDFFGRIIVEEPTRPGSRAGAAQQGEDGKEQEKKKVWVSFHEGFSNAVRKPITLEELMRGFG